MAQEEQFSITQEHLDVLQSANKGILNSSPYAACLCGKLLKVTDYMQKWHSGRWKGGHCLEPGINYNSLLCEDCEKEFKGWPRIVCLGCRSLMGFYTPGKQSTGFVFEPGRHYHIMSCPRCDDSIRSTPVLEHEQFCKVNKIPTTTDEDLLQEIEQKILQAEKEADKLRSEIQSSE